jgi:hypothetical protein
MRLTITLPIHLGSRASLACQIGPKMEICTRTIKAWYKVRISRIRSSSAPLTPLFLASIGPGFAQIARQVVIAPDIYRRIVRSKRGR